MRDGTLSGQQGLLSAPRALGEPLPPSSSSAAQSPLWPGHFKDGGGMRGPRCRRRARGAGELLLLGGRLSALHVAAGHGGLNYPPGAGPNLRHGKRRRVGKGRQLGLYLAARPGVAPRPPRRRRRPSFPASPGARELWASARGREDGQGLQAFLEPHPGPRTPSGWGPGRVPPRRQTVLIYKDSPLQPCT